MYAVLSWLLPLYAVFGLTAMAGMNSSFFAVFGCLWVLVAIGRRTGAGRKLVAALPTVSDYRDYKRWAWLMFGACMLSLIVAKLWPVEYAGREPDVTVHGFLKIWYLMIPATLTHVVLRASRDEGEVRALLEKVVCSWWVMTLFLGVIAVIQFNTGWPLEQVIPTNPDHYHAILFFGHHLSTASILPFPAFAALAYALGIYVRERRVARFALATGLTGLLILFLSYARTAWLTLPIGIALLLARYLSRRQFWVSFLSFAAVGTALCFTPAMKERIRNGMGIRERIELWEASIDYFGKRPITGIGWLKTAEMSEFYFKERDPEHYKDHFWGHAHSNFFEMLGGTGLIGLLAFFGWSWFTLRLAFRNSRRAQALGETKIADLSWGLFTGLVLLHLNGLTNVTFWEGKVMHQQMFAVGLLLIFSTLLRRL